MNVTPDLVKRTLKDNVDGFKFENFAQPFFSALTEQKYKPVGGIHDGGADGIFEDDGLYQQDKKNTHFVQISIEKHPKSKIKKTINRLLTYGRSISKLTYITSILISDIDKLEDDIYDEFNIRVKIVDVNYIASNIQYSRQTEEAFKNNLLDTYDFLRQFGHSSINFQDNSNNSPFLYAFLQQELNNKTDRSSLINSLTDSLILWALEGTNPDKGIFMSMDKILDKIISSMPTAKTFINSTLGHRLNYLYRLKDKNNKRTIQYWSQRQAYCLPYETRERIIEENINDLELDNDVKSIFKQKIIEFSEDTYSEDDIDLLVKISLKTLHITFENEGLEFISFMKHPDNTNIKPPIMTNIDKAFTVLTFSENNNNAKEVIRKLMVHIFYQNCDDNINVYLQKLSETYALLLSLKADSRIVDYFQKMSGEFSLFVGSDILVRCLSERFLDDDKKATTNVLKILMDANSTLVMTEGILNEVWNNLKISDYEYRNHFASIDQYIKPEIAKESNKILIRAYYYSKLSDNELKATTWYKFIEKFCDYPELHTISGKEQLRQYLINQYNLKYMSSEEVEIIIDKKIVEPLAEELIKVKKRKELAVNAATMVDLIYKQRAKNMESSRSSKFGYSTWWLTGEKATLSFTSDLVDKNFGFYIIRPEFLLYYISLIPTHKDVKETYKNIFPSILGIKMSGRLPSDELHKLLKSIDEAREHDESRLKVIVNSTINKLKSDFIREYNDDVLDTEYTELEYTEL